MDISNIKPIERTIEIKHPKTNVELGIRVSLVSLNDPKLQSVRRKMTDLRTRYENRNKVMKAAELEEHDNEMLFTAMTSWDWYGKDSTFEGKKPKFNKVQVLQIFKTLPWFKEQLTEAITEEQAFFQEEK